MEDPKKGDEILEELLSKYAQEPDALRQIKHTEAQRDYLLKTDRWELDMMGLRDVIYMFV